MQRTFFKPVKGSARPFLLILVALQLPWSSVDLCVAQKVFLEAQLDRIRAVVAHNKAQYRLKVATGGVL